MIDLDKKEYFAFLERWFQIFPEPKVSPDKIDAELVNIVEEHTS